MIGEDYKIVSPVRGQDNSHNSTTLNSQKYCIISKAFSPSRLIKSFWTRRDGCEGDGRPIHFRWCTAEYITGLVTHIEWLSSCGAKEGRKPVPENNKYRKLIRKFIPTRDSLKFYQLPLTAHSRTAVPNTSKLILRCSLI